MQYNANKKGGPGARSGQGRDADIYMGGPASSSHGWFKHCSSCYPSKEQARKQKKKKKDVKKKKRRR